VGTALVAETLGGAERLTESLASTGLEVVAVETERRRMEGARMARRDRESIVCGVGVRMRRNCGMRLRRRGEVEVPRFSAKT
jgi:hypothetical protein